MEMERLCVTRLHPECGMGQVEMSLHICESIVT